MRHATVSRIVKPGLRWAFILCIPLVLLSGSVNTVAKSQAVYEGGFSKYNIADRTGLDEEQLSGIASRLLSYFRGDAATPQMELTKADGATFSLFHWYELVHLADVRWLFELNSMLLFVAVVAVACYVIWHTLKEHGEWRSLASDALRGSAITLGLLAVVGVVALVDFQGLFVLFHVVSFDNPFWLLDPSTDYLVVLFPAGFWQDVGLITGALTGTKALFLAGTMGLLLRVSHNHTLRGKTARPDTAKGNEVLRLMAQDGSPRSAGRPPGRIRRRGTRSFA